MNRCLLVISVLVILSFFHFRIFDNKKFTSNCSQEVNVSNIYFGDIHRNVNRDNTSSFIMFGATKETNISIELSYVSNNSRTIFEDSGNVIWEKNGEQDFELKAKSETDHKISYPNIQSGRIINVPNEESTTYESSSDSHLESYTENINLPHLNDNCSRSKVSSIINESETSPKKEVSCNTQSLFERTTKPNSSENHLKIKNDTIVPMQGSSDKDLNVLVHQNATSTLTGTQLYCNVSSEVTDTCYIYIHEIYSMVQETFNKLVQVQYFANELTEELESIRNQILLTTQSEDQVTHIDDCTLDDPYQTNFNKMEESKLKMDLNFHGVKTRMLDLKKLFKIFEDLYRNGKHNSKVFQQAGIEILKVIRTVNTLMNLLQKESNLFLRSVPEFNVKCKLHLLGEN